ncbi:pyridoxamine kinase [Leptodontidium sp. MPI-SDFR-AT-0119]|nr:pyridoxamine kinase [Leptodontidium sp. MPI-SDFR-AT-0119]
MAGGRVIVIGSSRQVQGLHIEGKILAACSCEFSTVSTASVSHKDEIIQISETPCSEFELELGKCIEARVGAFKIGALYTADSITAISSVLQKCNNVHCVLDSEAIFKSRQKITPEIISAAREKLLPFTTVISATVPEAKLLLDNARIPIEYPQDMEDVKTLGKTLLSLGPKFVLIKREIFDEVAKETLHFVLCTNTEEPLVVASRFSNPNCVTGMSYSIPGVIAANLVNGHDIPTAVYAAFEFVEAAVREETLFS